MTGQEGQVGSAQSDTCGSVILDAMSRVCREERIRRDGLGYWRRLDRLWLKLCDFSPATCRDLAVELGWKSSEVRAKLGALRNMGLAFYDAPEWWAEDEE